MRKSILALILFIPCVFSLTFETRTINGSQWWVSDNNGSISPWVYINRTSGNAQMATTPSDDNTLMLRRSAWLQFYFGFARWNVALQRFVGDGADDLSSFSTYGFSDNETYWRTEANGTRTVSSRTFDSSFKHQQLSGSDYVYETWQFNSRVNLTFPTDLWYVQRLGNITVLDTVMWDTGNNLTGRPLNETNYVDNVTFVGVMDSVGIKGWHYQLPLEQYANKLAVYNGSVYIAYNLGRVFIANQKVNWTIQKIDANCQITCLPGDGVIQTFIEDYGFKPTNSSAQTPINWTVSDTLTDTLGSCTWTSDCALDIQAFSPYNPNAGIFSYRNINVTPQENQYAKCLSAYYPGLADNCSNGNNAAEIVNPVKNKEYLFSLIQPGFYNLLFSGPTTAHNVRSFFVSAGLAQTWNGTDRTTPNMTFVTKNNTPYTINYGQNITVFWNVTGFLTNVTAIEHNGTGTLALNTTTDLPDLWNNTANYTFQNLPVGAYIRYCILANGTSRGSGTSGIGKNWTSGKVCNELSTKQDTNATAGPGVPSFPAYLNDQDEEDDGKKNNLGILVFLLCAAIFVYILKTNGAKEGEQS